jgi:hypothetical protein
MELEPAGRYARAAIVDSVLTIALKQHACSCTKLYHFCIKDLADRRLRERGLAERDAVLAVP